jgi:hypothetical protein
MKLTITAEICYEKGHRFNTVSHVVLRIDNKTAIAYCCLGGKYSEQEALKEFKKNPSKWIPEGVYTPSMLNVLAQTL